MLAAGENKPPGRVRGAAVRGCPSINRGTAQEHNTLKRRSVAYLSKCSCKDAMDGTIFMHILHCTCAWPVRRFSRPAFPPPLSLCASILRWISFAVCLFFFPLRPMVAEAEAVSLPRTVSKCVALCESSNLHPSSVPKMSRCQLTSRSDALPFRQSLSTKCCIASVAYGHL